MQTRPIPRIHRFVVALSAPLRAVLLTIFGTAAFGALALGSISSVQAAETASSQSQIQQPSNLVTVVLTPTEDAFVAQNNPDNNFSDEESLTVGKINLAEAPVEFQSLLHFDLSAIPVGSVIQRAELRLLQTAATGQTINVNVARIEKPWKAEAVTWNTKPSSACCFATNSSPLAQNVPANWVVTDLVQSWVANPLITPNYGFELNSTGASLRAYSSMAGGTVPELRISYTSPATEIQIPVGSTASDVDGHCDLQTEYANAVSFPFADAFGQTGTVYLSHGNKYLNVCVIGAQGQLTDRVYTVYLDVDNGREPLAEADDYGLKLGILTPSGDDSLIGTGRGGYLTGQTLPTSWRGSAQEDTFIDADVAEYQIPLPLFESYCGAPFGIAVYHQGLSRTGDDYGWPTKQFSDQPQTWVQAALAGRNCRRVQVCMEEGRICSPAENASVFRTSDANSTNEYQTDANGIVPAQVNVGDTIWAMVPISNTPTYPISVTNPSTLYDTSGVPVTVQLEDFDPTTGILRLPVDAQYPLMVQEINVAAQWNLEGDPDFKRKLESDLRKMSDYFYDFTNGQFAIGTINVYQNYSNWFESNVWLHADNNQRPLAVVGGIVEKETPDLQLTDTISYGPGQIYIGSQWNRYFKPLGDPKIPQNVDISNDWSLAMAHELGHYLLFQWDTYYGLVPDEENPGETKAIPIDTCTGSAMGWVYDELNTEFISNQEHWNNHCDLTHAYSQLGERTEWETIKLWYPWAIAPAAISPTQVISGPIRPPVNLTTVNFIKDTDAKDPLEDQEFDLLYQAEKAASDRAKAYIIRDDRVIEQGQPAAGSKTIGLTGAQIEDFFCVFDIKNIVAKDDTSGPRHQFGCESLEQNDNELLMRKDDLWEPVITVTPITSASVDISVTFGTDIAAISLGVQIYPEHKQNSTTATLTQVGDEYLGTVELPEFTPAAYVRIFVLEDGAGSEEVPARQAMIGYGTGGSGVPGPSHWAGHAPISSPDGDLIIAFNEDIILRRGEFIAVQENYADPPPPNNTAILTGINSYRLISLPQSLVTSGAVSLRFLPPPVLHAASADPILAVYFWNGSSWKELDTQITQEPDGYFLASAPFDQAGIFALFQQVGEKPEMAEIYLPVILK